MVLLFQGFLEGKKSFILMLFEEYVLFLMIFWGAFVPFLILGRTAEEWTGNGGEREGTTRSNGLQDGIQPGPLQ